MRFPLTRYVTFEMGNYVVRAQRGENTEIATPPADDRRLLPNHTYVDFLLFDDRAALIHDYGLDGLQVGGWVTTAPSVLRRLAETTAQIRASAVPLADFLARHRPDLPGEAAAVASGVGRGA